MLSYSVVFIKKSYLLKRFIYYAYLFIDLSITLMFSWDIYKILKKVILKNTSEQLLLHWLFY